MIAVTTFDASGQILRWMEMPAEQDIIANLDPDELAMPGKYLPDTGYVSFDLTDPWATAAVVPLPDCPSPNHVFDYTAKVWTDPRTPADLVAALEARRAATRLTKLAFCEALMESGFLSPDEAAAAARGEVPASFADTIAAMTPEKRDRARIYWGGATLIERLDPLIVEVGAQRGITPETLDALFGIVAEGG